MPGVITDARVGQEFVGKPKRMTRERLWAFSGGPFGTPGWPQQNIHTDLAYAKSIGLAAVYTSATQYLGHLAELMLHLFGEAWLRGGKVSNIKFIKPVSEGDTIRAGARIRSSKQEGSIVIYDLDVWCQNRHREKVLLGTATCYVQELAPTDQRDRV